MTTVTEAQIGEWRASRRRDHQIAAHIASWARGQQKWTPLPPDDELGQDLDFAAAGSTWGRARDILTRLGVLGWNNSSGYYVATPPGEQPAGPGIGKGDR